MKKKQFFLTLCLILLSAPLSAYDFEVDGIYYNITSSTDMTVEVTYKTTNYNSYSGDVTIPTSVINNDTIYSVTCIGEKAFYNCSSLTSIVLPSSITSIGRYAFIRCSNIKSIIIPSSVTDIDVSAFSYCSNLTSVTIFANITSIHSNVFTDCSNLTSIEIPSSVTSIGSMAFWGCKSLKSINIPSNVTSIGAYAFEDCSSLTSINFPASLKKIETGAFFSCTSLNSIYSYIEPPFAFTSNLFSDISYNNTILYVPLNKKSIYASTHGWKDFVHIIEMPWFYNESGIFYKKVENYSDRIIVDSANTSGNITIPSTISSDGSTFSVTQIADGAFANNKNLVSVSVPSSVTTVGTGVFSGCTSLAAITWNANTALTDDIMGTQTNPNLLVYVTNSSYAPKSVSNIVVNGTADNITLTDAASGNNFYCPTEFTARNISYAHSYSMTTGRGTCQGWETLALPFDVQTISHSANGRIIPFASYTDTGYPFWLYELTSQGWQAAKEIKANTPYIISMPNNPNYSSIYNLAGQVTFSAVNSTVKASATMNTASHNDKTFTPCLQTLANNSDGYALNVNNSYVTDASGYTEGSTFVKNLRDVHPFEAYMTSSAASAKEAFSVFDVATGIEEVVVRDNADQPSAIFDLLGRKVGTSSNANSLKKGIYIKNGKKIIIK